MIKPTFRTFRRIAVTTALTTAMTGATVTAQDSVRDRLSPGNGADWAGEIHAGPNEYDQSVNRNRFDNEYYGYGNNGANQQRTVSPNYYRDARTGRFFYLDENNRAVFDQSNSRITGQLPSSQGQPQFNQGQQSDNRGQILSGQSNQRPLLGVALEDTDQGIRVVDVARNSAAQQAGIQPGDVIVEFNGTASSGLNAGMFTSQVGQMNPGDQLTLVIKRDGKNQQLNATLGSQSRNQRYQSAKSPVQDSSSQAIKQRLEELQMKVDRLEQKLDDMSRQNSATENAAASPTAKSASTPPSADSEGVESEDLLPEQPPTPGDGLDEKDSSEDNLNLDDASS